MLAGKLSLQRMDDTKRSNWKERSIQTIEKKKNEKKKVTEDNSFICHSGFQKFQVRNLNSTLKTLK